MVKEDVSQLTYGSDKLITVTCDSKSSSKCIGTRKLKYYTYFKNITNNNGKYFCQQCSNTQKNSGRLNPNCKYLFDDNYFEKIDSEDKSYFLGWIASDGHISGNRISISIHEKDIDILHLLKDLICKDLPIYRCKSNMATLSIASKKMATDVCKHLKIQYGKKSNIVQFPEIEDKYKRHFIRGYFDGDGHVSSPNKTVSPTTSITSSSLEILNTIKNILNIPCYLFNSKCSRITYYSNNALDMLHVIYKDCNLKLKRKYDLYLRWSTWTKSYFSKSLPNFVYGKVYKEACPPFKARASDSGYDLTLMDIKKTDGEVIFYGTGIKLRPDYGWYFDLVPRSSISKTGYMLANSIGIIDRTYLGEIIVPLIKIDKNKPDLSLPCRVVQVIPRQIINVDFKEISEEDILDTERGAKGFGSSGS